MNPTAGGEPPFTFTVPACPSLGKESAMKHTVSETNQSSQSPGLMMAEMASRAEDVASLLRVLANRHRLLILCALLPGPLTVSQLCQTAESIGQSAVSQHLAKLKALELVESTKEGQHVYYRIADRRVERLLALLKEEYCS